MTDHEAVDIPPPSKRVDSRDLKSKILDFFRWSVTLIMVLLAIKLSCPLGEYAMDHWKDLLGLCLLIALMASVMVGSFLGGLFMSIDDEEYERSPRFVRGLRDFGVLGGYVLGAIVGLYVGLMIVVYVSSSFGLVDLSKDQVKPDSLAGFLLGYYWEDPNCERHSKCPLVMAREWERFWNGSVPFGTPGTNASIVNAGNSTNWAIDFILPSGPQKETVDSIQKDDKTDET